MKKKYMKLLIHHETWRKSFSSFEFSKRGANGIAITSLNPSDIIGASNFFEYEPERKNEKKKKLKERTQKRYCSFDTVCNCGNAN